MCVRLLLDAVCGVATFDAEASLIFAGALVDSYRTGVNLAANRALFRWPFCDLVGTRGLAVLWSVVEIAHGKQRLIARPVELPVRTRSTTSPVFNRLVKSA